MLFEKTVQRYIQNYYRQCFRSENVFPKLAETVFCYIFAAIRLAKSVGKGDESS